MKNENALISIIVPVYNVEKYVEKCLDTICGQTYKNIEIIVVNDGSKDKSKVICEKKAVQDKRIKLINKKNEGLGFARNTGLDHASGEYVIFIDSDDFIEQNMVEKLYLGLIKNGVDTCYCGYYRYYGDNKIVPINQNHKQVLIEQHEIISKVLLEMLASAPEEKTDRNLSMAVWHGIYSMKIIKQNHIVFPSERQFISEDIIFDIQYLQKSKRIYFIDECLYYYRCNPNSLTRSYREKEFYMQKKLTEEIERQLSRIHNKEEYEHRISKFYLGRARHCMNQEILHRKELGKEQFLKNMTEILNDDRLRKVISHYPIKKEKITRRSYNYMVKMRSIRGITLLTILKGDYN